MWVMNFKADIARYREYTPDWPSLALVIMHQGLWALLQYRIAHAVYVSRAPAPIKRPVLVLCVLWEKLVEITTGIEIPYRARIGPGLYIAHFGNIIIHKDVIIGRHCNLSQGVSLGISGRGDRRGTPILGDRVLVLPNAVVAGKIVVADEVVIGANATLTEDAPPRAVFVGNPARIVSDRGSSDYLSPSRPDRFSCRAHREPSGT